MIIHPRPVHPDVFLRLIVPDTKVYVGPFKLDPLKTALGFSLPGWLGPMLAGESTHRRGRGGEASEVFLLRLRDGQIYTLDLTRVGLGELSLGARRGLLVVGLPIVAAQILQARLERVTVSRRYQAGAFPMEEMEIPLDQGINLTFSLGSIGELGLEVGESQ